MQKETVGQSSNSERIASLDLCRGLAAIGVLIFHMDFLFLGDRGGATGLIPRGYLCVDFFFLLSGYVISISYDEKLSKGLTTKSFIWIRFARLWPLLALTCLAGLVLHVARSMRDHGTLGLDLVVVADFGLNLLMVPAFIGAAITFPYNPAAWSIFLEFAINAVYAAFFRHMKNSVIILLLLAGVVGLMFTATANNSLDVGWSISNLVDAVPRVVYSFFLGVVICRYRHSLRFNCPPYVFAAVLALTVVPLCLPTSASMLWEGLFELAVVVLLFPLLLVVSINTRLPNWADTLGFLIGGFSYSLYLWQTPMLIAFSAVPQILIGQKIAELTPWSGLIFFPFIFAASYVSWVYFERPAQRWLRAFASSRSRESPTQVQT